MFFIEESSLIEWKKQIKYKVDKNFIENKLIKKKKISFKKKLFFILNIKNKYFLFIRLVFFEKKINFEVLINEISQFQL